MRTESHVRIAAIRSRPECSASESTPRLPVARARNTLSVTRISAEPIDPSAAICLTEVGEREMGKPRKDYTMGTLRDDALMRDSFADHSEIILSIAGTLFGASLEQKSALAPGGKIRCAMISTVHFTRMKELTFTSVVAVWTISVSLSPSSIKSLTMSLPTLSGFKLPSRWCVTVGGTLFSLTEYVPK